MCSLCGNRTAQALGEALHFLIQREFLSVSSVQVLICHRRQKDTRLPGLKDRGEV